jgi:hypothetical protein
LFSGVFIQFYAYYLILFLVGFYYIYIWTMVRSLFLVMGKVGYSGRSQSSVDLDIFFPLCADKKENQMFLIYKENQNGSVAKSYMTIGLHIYG